MQTLFKKMAESGSTQPKRLTLEAGPMCFHYIIASNVAFLTLAERGYPKVSLAHLSILCRFGTYRAVMRVQKLITKATAGQSANTVAGTVHASHVCSVNLNTHGSPTIEWACRPIAEAGVPVLGGAVLRVQPPVRDAGGRRGAPVCLYKVR